MVVCFAMGKKSEEILEKMRSILDSVTFIDFPTISDIIKGISLRHLTVDRIVLLGTIIKESTELRDLSEFLFKEAPTTEVILVLNSRNYVSADLKQQFINAFNSPLYTVVELDKVTPRVLSEIVVDDISAINSTFSVDLSVKSDNFAKSVEYSSTNSSMYSSISHSRENEVINTRENTSLTGTNGIGNSMDSLGRESSNREENILNTNSNTSVRGSLGATQKSSFLGVDLSRDLSLGSYGEVHSDTEVLKANTSTELVVYNSNIGTSKEFYTPAKTKVDIIIGLRGTCVKDSLLNESKSIVASDNARVLIIDADYQECNILSSLDIKRFYQERCDFGIDNSFVYSEDNIDYICNGFGVPLSMSSIDNLLNGNLLNLYDIIYLYCPMDCLNILSEQTLEYNNIILNPGNTFSNYIATSLLLTNRFNMSIECERALCKNCYIDSDGISDEDITRLNDICLFPNGSWVDRYGL